MNLSYKLRRKTVLVDTAVNIPEDAIAMKIEAIENSKKKYSVTYLEPTSLTREYLESLGEIGMVIL